ncbi:hypothetical protein BH18CHL2_BH18CHL2_04480 [soil metagenome]
MVVFGSILFFVLGLAAWAAADRYYTANLQPTVSYAGRLVPTRDYQRELRYQLVRFYIELGVPPEFENDSRIASRKAEYEGITLDKLIEDSALERAAREAGVDVAGDVDARYVADFSQFRSRHILVEADAEAADKDASDAAALAKAQDLAAQLRAAPQDQELWNRLAKESSSDPGSKDSGGELGFVGKGQFVKEFEDAAAKLAVGGVSDPAKSSFGYHVIQVQERRGPEESEVVKRFLASGFTTADIREHVRLDPLKDEFTRRAQEGAISSPTEQIHLAKILVNTPPPQGADLTAFTEGLRKISEIQTALEKGEEFGEVAKKHSEDSTAEQGGDAGWLARGMLTDLSTEQELFALAPGTNSRQFSTRTQTTFDCVLEKDAARALTEDQITQLKGSAFAYWLAREKERNGARKLVKGFEFE